MAGGAVNTVQYVAVVDDDFVLPAVVNCVSAVIVYAPGFRNMAAELVKVLNTTSITIVPLPAKKRRTTKNTKGTKR